MSQYHTDFANSVLPIFRQSPFLPGDYVLSDSGLVNLFFSFFFLLVTFCIGTCLVHTAPNHGAEDFGLCKQHQVGDETEYVNDVGVFTAAAGVSLQGLSVWSSFLNYFLVIFAQVLDKGNLKVIEMLRERGQLLSVSDFKHRYPYDWRTKKPIIMRATNQWFADLSDIRNKALQALENVEVYRNGCLVHLPLNFEDGT